MKIDIERLIDAVTAENEAYNEYCYSSKTLYRGPFEVETFAAVALTHTNNRDYFNFGVKTMEESMGPCEDHCPASILSLLSPY